MSTAHVQKVRNSPRKTVAEAGLEPDCDFVTNDDGTCSCEICQTLSAANALQLERAWQHSLALVDAELQSIIAAWPTLAGPIRKAVLALIDAAQSP